MSTGIASFPGSPLLESLFSVLNNTSDAQMASGRLKIFLARLNERDAAAIILRVIRARESPLLISTLLFIFSTRRRE